VTLKALAMARKLAAPTLRLNIAKRQVNIAGNPPSPAVEGTLRATP
jgi:hypothetical protein